MSILINSEVFSDLKIFGSKVGILFVSAFTHYIDMYMTNYESKILAFY